MPGFSITQKRRLVELNAETEIIDKVFHDVAERDNFFDDYITKVTNDAKVQLRQLASSGNLSALSAIERDVSNVVTSLGFTEVRTPIIIPESYIRKMGIDENNKLWKQIVWLGNNKCLRPMLAPNLYHMLKSLRRFIHSVSIFEIGPCFREEEEGTLHLLEFTMANIVVLAPDKDPNIILKEIISRVMQSADLPDYKIEESSCVVYGKTLDVFVNDTEVASGVVGPIPMDKNWGIDESWAGVGFGLERLVMLKRGLRRIKPVGRSLTHLNGIYLNM